MTQYTPVYVGKKEPKNIKSQTELSQAIDSLRKRVSELEVEVNALKLERETKSEEVIA